MSVGWRLKTAIDLTRKINGKSTFYFEKDVECLPIRTRVTVVAFISGDKIQAIFAPTSLLDALRDAISKFWRVNEETSFGSAHEWILGGWPWDVSHWHGKALALNILITLRTHGYRVVASADVNARYVSKAHGDDYPADPHAWFCVPSEALEEEEEEENRWAHLELPPSYAAATRVSPIPSAPSSDDEEDGDDDKAARTDFICRDVPEWGSSLYQKRF